MKFRLFPRTLVMITAVLFMYSCAPVVKQPGQTKPVEVLKYQEVHAKNGILSSSHPLASAAGLEIIEKGGNAVDAAVATAFALGVLEPNASGIGGEGMMLIHKAGSDGPIAIDFRSCAPKVSGEQSQAKKWKAALAGPTSIGIPGMVAGAYHAWDKYGSGKVTFAQCLEPAIRYATQGVELNQAMGDALVIALGKIQGNPILSSIFLTEDGLLKEEGQSYRMVLLAETLKVIAEGGADVFYKGALAQKMATDIQEAGGVLTVEDFANYPLYERKALKGTYRGHEIYSSPGPVGGLAVINALQALNHFEVKSYGFQTAKHLNLVNEAMKLGFGDLFKYAKDMAFHDIPYDQLLSLEYAAARAAHIGPTTNIGPKIMYAGLKTPGYVPYKKAAWNLSEIESMQTKAAKDGDYELKDRKMAVGDTVVRAPRKSAMTRTLNTATKGESKEDIPLIRLSPSTTHFVSVDKKGNMVTWTQTVSWYFGSGYVSPQTGVIFNNEMYNFSRVRSGFKPYERMVTTISPTAVFKDGKPYMCLGAPGALKIAPAVVNVIVNNIDFNMGLQASIEAPRFSSNEFFPTKPFDMENRFSSQVVEKLKSFGQNPVVDSSAFNRKFGSVQAALYDWENGMVVGGADPRRGASAQGF
ncbi:MAG: gamma-glutamyltransferase family protein [Proteobacteria bacterium]|nr:gamma-glutamyltransferase family protein [Pseudomonadota bacterium]